MTVGKVKDFSFPRHHSTPPKTVHYAKGGFFKDEKVEISGGRGISHTPNEPEVSGDGQRGPNISGGPKLAKGGGIHIKPSHKGLLHKDLGVKAGSKIPARKLEAAEHSSSPAVRKRAVFAENAKHWDHKASGGRAGHPAGCTCSMCHGGRV
jgi:hypothetical protein